MGLLTTVQGEIRNQNRPIALAAITDVDDPPTGLGLDYWNLITLLKSRPDSSLVYSFTFRLGFSEEMHQLSVTGAVACLSFHLAFDLASQVTTYPGGAFLE